MELGLVMSGLMFGFWKRQKEVDELVQEPWG